MWIQRDSAHSLSLNAWRVGHGQVWKVTGLKIGPSLLARLPLSWMTLGNSLNQSEVWVLREMHSSVQWL